MKSFFRNLFSVHYTATVSEIILENLPFKPSSREVIYASRSDDEVTDKFFRRRYKTFNKVFARYYQEFVYMPLLSEEIVADTEFWQYNFPQVCWAQQPQRPVLGNDYLLRFVKAESEQHVARGQFLLQYEGTSDYELPQGQYRFFCISIDTSECKLTTRYANYMMEQLRSYMVEQLRSRTKRYNDPNIKVVKYRLVPPTDADGNFSSDISKELRDIQKRIWRLEKGGVSRAFLREYLWPEPPLSHLVIDADYRIWLPDYQNMEIKMAPLAKSVFLLFLRHPEGILFKELADYQQELAQIYACIKEKKPLLYSPHLHLRIDEHIEALTDPFDNSINEKCARIKEAFIQNIANDMARHYYVDGKRGEPKRIILSPDKIVWKV
ncbi:MAG: hypothetical protein IJ816_03470 [Alloprevotella sp.]|nr:hypothetical protein [Alloprevotella sp.]